MKHRPSPVLLGVIPIVLLLGGCGQVGRQVAVLQGNYQFSQGKFQSATVHYLEALSPGDDRALVAFNLGNVYHALGESEAALRMWDQAEEGSGTDLLFGTSFNRGVLLYELGRYDEAVESFRYALQLRSDSVDAKINLELSLQKVTAAEGTAGSGAVPDSPTEESPPDENVERVLEFVRRRGVERWIGNSDPADEESARDW